MRTKAIARFKDYTSISIKDPYYLVYKYLIRDLKYSIKKYAVGKVIDIGCGNKPYESIFGGNITEYIGCDIVQSSLQKVDILCEANKIPLPDAYFDTVFSTQTIEHVADHQGVINEAFRLLKSGGYAIFSGPLYWHLHEEPYDFFRFTKYGFQYLFEKAGFDIVEILPNGGMWATTGQVIIHSYLNEGNHCNFFFKIYRKVFLKFRIYVLLNIFYEWLDKINYNTINTMNYVIVVKKK